MKMDDIKGLLNQIQVIQEVLNDYHIKDAVFYGSRVMGRHRDSSDFDLTCRVDHLKKLIICNPEFYSPNYPPERWITLTLEEVGKELSYKLRGDINLTSAESNEDLYDSIREHNIPLILNGVKLDRDELKSNIIELRSKDTPTQIERDNDAYEYYLLSHLAKLTTIVRFNEIFRRKSDFYKPKAMYKISMRNDIISNIAIFSLCTEKVPEDLFCRLNLNFEELKAISYIVRQKQRSQNNYNALELGWLICGEDDLEQIEMALFEGFFSKCKELLLQYLFKCKDNSVFESAFFIFERGIKDRNGLISYYRNEYKNHNYPMLQTPFKNILNHTFLREKCMINLFDS